MKTQRILTTRIIQALFVVVLAAAAFVPREASARVRLKDICTIYGEREVKLVGIGLVTGLNGTGDGGKNLPAVRALAAAMKLMHTPVLDFSELKDAKNFSIVWVEATIPKNGARRGQTIDCYVTSFMGAKSLRGGRLLPSPLETAEIDDDKTRGMASGALVIENPKEELVARIPGGVTLTDDFIRDFIDVYRGGVITLLLDSSHSSFQAASEVARVVNSEFTFEVGSNVARATGPGVIEVRLPQQYRDSPVEFVAAVLEVSVDNPNTQSRVVVNNKTGLVLIDGEVELSPVVITHKNLIVQVGNDAAQPAEFVGLVDQTQIQNSQQLSELLEALNQLKVPPEDVIGIIRELHRSGKLHAEYDER